MKTIALPLLALAGLVAPASAFANPTASTVAPMLALPTRVPAAQPVPCSTQLTNLMQKLQSGQYYAHVDANAVVMSGDKGYAEACREGGEGFCASGTDAKISDGKLGGMTRVVDYSSSAARNLVFNLVNVDGVAKIEWRFLSKSYSSTVKSCTGGYWTASTGKSAVVIHLDDAQPMQTPE